jgi:hypothetical protein
MDGVNNEHESEQNNRCGGSIAQRDFSLADW